MKIKNKLCAMLTLSFFTVCYYYYFHVFWSNKVTLVTSYINIPFQFHLYIIFMRILILQVNLKIQMCCLLRLDSKTTYKYASYRWICNILLFSDECHFMMFCKKNLCGRSSIT